MEKGDYHTHLQREREGQEKPSNYRPVALTSSTAKLAERLVATRLVYHLESKKKLAPCQAGFRRGRSTEEQLARVTQDIFDGLEAKEPRRAALVLLDFIRAYDKTWKAALYVKLKDLDVPTCMIRWIKGFLADRRARVRWNDTLSKARVFREGLPKGTVLAPVLWLCYCNDIWQTVHDRAPDCSLSLFADDTALVASDRELKKCATKLQPALDAVTEWCSRWKVQLAQYEDAAESKCCYTVFTLDPAENNNKTKLSLTLADHPVKFEKNPTFLGLKLDCQLTFAAHAENVKKRMAKRRNGLADIARRSVGTSQHNLRAAYIATTRAVADYCSAVWMNHAQPSTRKAVEAAQNKCARVITGCLGLTNEKALLACADLPPLRHVAQERASVLRERLLRIPDDVPAHKTAKAWVQPRLKSRNHESWKRNNDHEPDDTDTHRTHRGCWRRIATEMDCIAELDSFPREQISCQIAPWTLYQPETFFGLDVADRDIKKEKCDSRVFITNDLLDSLTKDDIKIWTDGSVQEGNKNGGGAAIITTKLTSTTLKSAAGAVASSYEAEMEAIKITLDYVSTLGQEHGTSVRIMTDSLFAQQTSDRPRGPGHQLWHHHVEGG